MAPSSLLIAGRGFPAIFAARLAEARGYRTTLLLDPDPAPLSLVMGAGGGILSRLEAEVGAALCPTSPVPLSTPVMLSLGEPLRYLGAASPASSVSPEEARRFLLSLDASLSGAIFPELARTMALSHEKTSARAPFFSRLANWVFEPEREKERLPRRLKAEARRILAPVGPLLFSLLPFSGLSGSDLADPEVLRLLQNATAARMMGLPPLEFSSGPPPDVTLWHGKFPAVLETTGRGRRYQIAGEAETYDRLLLMTESSDPAFVSGVIEVDRTALPPHWPTLVYLPREEGGESREARGGVLLAVEPSRRGGVSRGWLWGEILPGEAPAQTLLSGVDRLNGQALLPVLNRPTLVRREPRPFVSTGEIPLGGLREMTSYLKKGGHLSLLRDPTLLPLVTEDFWADLSLALPARATVRSGR
ncbi:MAG: hypothetical protein ACP5OP_04855 [Leptospirillia bacterium]